MVGSLVLRGVAVVGSLTAVAAGSVYLYRRVPSVYPRGRTRLDARSYRVVRAALAVGVVIGALGAVVAVVDTVGTVRALGAQRTGFLTGLAILLPDWLGPGMVRVGVGMLVGGAVLAGAVEVRNARE